MPTPSLKIDHARYLVTVDPQRRIIQDGSVLIEDGRIRQVGKAAELAGARADRTIDARHMVVTPGFVNGHMHISYGHVVRGIFPDDVGSPLPTVFKLQMAMTEEEEHASTLLGLVELLKNGTVAFVDPGSTKFPDACLQAYEDAGIRVILGECVTDQEAPFPLPRFETKDAVARSAAFIDKWHGRRGRPRTGVGHAVLAGDVQRRPAACPQAGSRRPRHVAHAAPQQRRQGAPGLPEPPPEPEPDAVSRVARRARWQRGPRPRPRRRRRRDRRHGAHAHDGGDVSGHRSQGRPRRRRARSLARAAGQGA